MDRYPVGRSIQSILPKLLKEIDLSKGERREKVVEVWPEILGESYAVYTEIISLNDDTLTVRVKSATLYSILVMQEREKTVKKFQEKYPNLGVKKIVFRR